MAKRLVFNSFYILTGKNWGVATYKSKDDFVVNLHVFRNYKSSPLLKKGAIFLPLKVSKNDIGITLRAIKYGVVQ